MGSLFSMEFDCSRLTLDKIVGLFGARSFSLLGLTKSNRSGREGAIGVDGQFLTAILVLIELW